jgi:hypothetical protein
MKKKSSSIFQFLSDRPASLIKDRKSLCWSSSSRKVGSIKISQLRNMLESSFWWQIKDIAFVIGNISISSTGNVLNHWYTMMTLIFVISPGAGAGAGAGA